MPKTARKTIMKSLRCTACDTIQQIQRLVGRNKAAGHIKHIWCIVCKRTTAHEEMAER